MSLVLFALFVIAAFLGAELISKVPATLHTPLMSGSNAISGISIVGALIVTGAVDSPAAKWIGFAALVLATINVVGGFLVTDRMLEMFKPRVPREAEQDAEAEATTVEATVAKVTA